MRRSFMATVADLRAGRTQDELTEELGRLTKAVMDTGRAGELVLKIKIKPAAKDSTLVTITDDVQVKAPKADRSPTLMFTNVTDGSLSLDDPDAAPKGKLRSVDAEPGQLKETSNG